MTCDDANPKGPAYKKYQYNTFVDDPWTSSPLGYNPYETATKEYKKVSVSTTTNEPLKFTINANNVHNPKHYNHNEHGIECITAIEASMTTEQFIGYLKGNVEKYVWRFQYKDGTQDLNKAKWYLEKLIEVYGKDKA